MLCDPQYRGAASQTQTFPRALQRSDRGACNLNSTLPELWAPIKLVHFGAYSKDVKRDLHIETIDDKVGAGCSCPARSVTLHGNHSPSCSGHQAKPLLAQVGRDGYGCFQPEKDIVVAPYHDQLAEIAHNTYNTEEGRKAFEAERPILLAFAGGWAPVGARLCSCVGAPALAALALPSTCSQRITARPPLALTQPLPRAAGGIRYNEPEYSGGIRQRLFSLFKNNRTQLPKEDEKQR